MFPVDLQHMFAQQLVGGVFHKSRGCPWGRPLDSVAMVFSIHTDENHVCPVERLLQTEKEGANCRGKCRVGSPFICLSHLVADNEGRW